MRRRNSGVKRKLSAENTAVAMSLQRLALLVDGTGVSGVAAGAGAVAQRRQTPPMYFAA